MSLFFWTLFSTLAAVLVYMIIKYGRLIWNLIITFPRDVNFVYRWFRTKILINYVIRNKFTVHDYFDNQAKKMPNNTCFLFEDEIWTYKKVQDESYKIGNYFQQQGYVKGDSIALFMENRPDYVAIWLGLGRIGVITSLINFNLRFKALEHCVQASKCKAVIFGNELSKAIKDVIKTGGFREEKLFYFEDRNLGNMNKIVSPRYKNVTKEIKFSEPNPTLSNENIGMNDVLLNLFTSGTTGLPKAVILSHLTVISWSTLHIRGGLSRNDVLMTPMPLYHVAGGIMGITSSLFHGTPQVILKKFSASTFWDQCIKYNGTIKAFLTRARAYEIGISVRLTVVPNWNHSQSRYLVNQPEKAVDKMHKVRKFIGGGVNTVIGCKLIKRFNQIKIIEAYGCTEGCISTTNFTRQIGACGFHPIWALSMVPACIAKVDDCKQEILRDVETGLVKMAEIGEAGEYLGKIIQGDPAQEFLGYTNKEATENKIIRNVKVKGDAWFKSGDIFQRDELGFLYFKDRAGDNFRWQGENVSTSEVSEVVINASGMTASAVYGVEISGTEGKCGMAAIFDPEGTLDLEKLATELSRCLPKYAHPLFLRVMHKEMDVSGTFKLQKLDLQKEGFNIAEIQDCIYFLKGERYVSLDSELYNQIISGSIKV